MICFWIVCNFHYDYLTVDYYAVVKVRSGLKVQHSTLFLVGAEFLFHYWCYSSLLLFITCVTDGG